MLGWRMDGPLYALGNFPYGVDEEEFGRRMVMCPGSCGGIRVASGDDSPCAVNY